MINKVNLKKEVDAIKELYVYKKIGLLNRHVLSVVRVENRTLDFHIHENSDELFYVIEGSFHLETDNGLMGVEEGEFVIVPKGTRHRPVVDTLTKFLMIELAGVLNKENSGDLYEE
jgi:mannose-6-phosphate isomerase-like protein (cupin superfamily)